MTEIHCQCGLKAEVTVTPPQSGLPMNWTPTFPEDDAARLCRFARQRPVNVRGCPEMTRAVEAAVAAGRLTW